VNLEVNVSGIDLDLIAVGVVGGPEHAVQAAKELAEVVNEEKAKVVAAVRSKAASLIAESVAAGIGGKR
jgi:hypothetical protein